MPTALTRIEASEVMKRALSAIDEYNSACPIRIDTRMLSDGTEQKIHRPVGRIPESVTQTFHVVLTQYIHDYNRSVSMMPAGLYTKEEPPALRTNSVRLAVPCRCSDRTVRNHLRRLQKLSMLTTKWHGSKANFEVWISSNLLWGDGFQFAQETTASASQAAPEARERNIFPHNGTHREIFEIEKGNADMLVCGHGESDQRQRGRTGNAGLNPAGPGENHGGEIKLGGGAAARKAAIVAQNEQQRLGKAKELTDQWRVDAPRGLNRQFVRYLFDFWGYAWKVVYPNREFVRDEQEKALKAIAAGVYQGFGMKWSEKQWDDYHLQQLRKLDMAGRYFDNHPDKHAPDPFSRFIQGRGYFDAENLKGFVGIDAWIKKEGIQNAHNRQMRAEAQERKHRRIESLLRQARRDFEKLANAKPMRKEVLGKSEIGLYHFYDSLFANLGAKWRSKFAEQYLAQRACNFAQPAYYKPRNHRRRAGENIDQGTVVIVEPWMESGEGYYSEM